MQDDEWRMEDGLTTQIVLRYVHTMQCGTACQGRAAKADQHGQQKCHACLHVHTKVTFLGDFFQFTKNVCVRKNSVIGSPGTLH